MPLAQARRKLPTNNATTTPDTLRNTPRALNAIYFMPKSTEGWRVYLAIAAASFCVTKGPAISKPNINTTTLANINSAATFPLSIGAGLNSGDIT